MKTSELIAQLQWDLECKGDLEVVMMGTVLPEGYNSNKLDNISDVFISTVETTREVDDTLQLFWQM